MDMVQVVVSNRAVLKFVFSLFVVGDRGSLTMQMIDNVSLYLRGCMLYVLSSQFAPNDVFRSTKNVRLLEDFVFWEGEELDVNSSVGDMTSYSYYAYTQ